jgi:type I restriction enzyme S subunit
MMPQRNTAWRQLKISDLLKYNFLEIGDGYRAKNIEMASTGLPFARAGNINNGFNFEDADLLSEKSVALAKNKLSQPGDSVITTKGTFGRVAYVRPDTPKFVYSPQLCYWRSKDPEVIHPKFVYYWLQGPDFIAQAFQVKSSTDMADYTNLTDQRRMSITAPGIGSQKKIAAILSAYDDLIENNKRRIALLEKMAEEIYREWFVRFRFPGHEQVKMVKGVPEGWDKVRLEMAFPYTGGGTPSKEVERYWQNGDVNWYTPSDITASQGIFLSRSSEQCAEEGLNSSSARLFPAYSIMMTSRATIGAIGINTTPACTNQGFITCIPNERYPLTFLYHWLKLSKPYFELLSGGATFAELTKGTFKKIEILTPPKPLVDDFERRVSPMFKQIELLLKQMEGFIKTRNMLLPRLISGKLQVEHLDIRFPPAMEEVSSDTLTGREMHDG